MFSLRIRIKGLRPARRLVGRGIILIASLALPSQGQAQDAPRAERGSLEEFNREIRPRVRRLVQAALEARRHDSAVSPDLDREELAVQAKEHAFLQAELARESAEIEVVVHKEGLVLQERATIEGKVRIAEGALSDAKKRVESIEAVLRKAKAFPATQVHEMKAVYDIQRLLRAAQLNTQRAQLGLEQEQGKLKAFKEYEAPRRMKEKFADVERARADERRAEEEFKSSAEALKQRKSQRAAERNRKRPDWSPLVASLGEVLKLEKGLGSLLSHEPPTADAEARRGWEASVSSEATKLKAALDRADQSFADIQFDELGRRVRELVQAVAPAVESEPQK